MNALRTEESEKEETLPDSLLDIIKHGVGPTGHLVMLSSCSSDTQTALRKSIMVELLE
jgi:hypothetical protein